MNENRHETRQHRLVTVAAAGLAAAIYLTDLFWKNASAYRDVRVHWARDLARESGTLGVIWVVLTAGVVTLAVTLLARRGSIALLLVIGILVGCLGLESYGLVEQLKFRRMLESMTHLREVGLKILEDSKSLTSGLPLDLPPEIVADKACRDGWGHPPRYVRISPNHGILIAAGSDGRIEANAEAVKSGVFPPSRFDHDIIGEIVNGEFSFTVYPDGPAQGTPCAIYSAFGCLSYG